MEEVKAVLSTEPKSMLEIVAALGKDPSNKLEMARVRRALAKIAGVEKSGHTKGVKYRLAQPEQGAA